jgi:hypothetical protein
MKEYFSSRYNFQPKKIKKIDEIDEGIKNRIWNLFVKCVNVLRDVMGSDIFIEKLWDKFFKGKINDLQCVDYNYDTGEKTYSLSDIENKFFQLEWYKYYDFLEFLMKEPLLKDIVAEEANKIFTEENIECRVINYLVVPIMEEEEIGEIEQAQRLNNRYEKVKIHLQKALELYAKRPQPDYKNSIKESISAIEALARIITNNPSATLGDLTKQLPIHPAFRDGLNKIYGWTSDEGGIRHSQKDYKDYLESGEDEARFMLVLAHVFVNYIIKKYEKQQ